MAKAAIYIFEAKLKDTRFENSRKIGIAATPMKTLADLAYTILSAYDIGGEHLFSFTRDLTEREKMIAEIAISEKVKSPDYDGLTSFNGKAKNYYEYYLPNPEEDNDFPRSRLISNSVFDAKLPKVMTEVGQTLEFTYDFGDNWDFEVTLTEIITDETVDRRSYPQLISGKGYPIEEDCGGVPGLEELIQQKLIEAFALDELRIRFRNNVQWLKYVYEVPQDS
jgi:hypothetical protein